MVYARTEEQFISELTSLYDPGEAKALFLMAVEHICKINRAQYLFVKHHEMLLIHETSVLDILNELKTGKPIQYILGETFFFGFPVKVNPSVLIPRPETEELVNWVITEATKQTAKRASAKPEKLTIIDMGTGSGCIPIALKKNLPDAEVWGMDVSSEALETALRNAVLNKTEVKFIQADILNGQFGNEDLHFDIIISNPPYITDCEKEKMHSNVLQHEPHLALFVPDDDPLLFYKAIAKFAEKYLTENGLLFLEMNENYANELVKLLTARGFANIKVKKDMQGKDRMICAQLK